MYDIFYVSKNLGATDQWDRIRSRYPTAQRLTNIKDFDQIREKSFTKMFWVIWDDIVLSDDFDLTKYRPTKWDDMYIHVFRNGEYYDGINLFPRDIKITKKEFEHRYFIEKKEIDTQASTPRPYDRFDISTYDEYLEANEKSITDMFWVVWKEIEILDDSIFNLYFSHHNLYDRNENHVYKHLFRKEYTYVNGPVLFSKNKKISKREFNHRYLIDKKEHDLVVSKFKPYDIVFISYDEPNADENYNKLLERCPGAKRIHGITGIHQAHIKAAELSSTEMFWVVDGDAEILEDFKFDHEVSTYERDTVHVWHSRNPINDLIYGYGGVKLLPKTMTLNMDTNTTDMTTAISKKFKSMPSISNITVFNTDPFNTWKSAFRECVKLSSKVIDRQDNDETIDRLKIWSTVGTDRPYGEYSLSGANDGLRYGEENKNNPEALSKINDFKWLEERFGR